MISLVAPYDNTGDPTQVGEPDGHGLFGLLDEDADGLLCHICGWRGPHLGLHAYKGHGMSARQYKLEHGLRRSKGLVATAVLEKLAERGAAQMPSRTGFVAARDPRRATAARLAGGMPLSPAGAAASASGRQTPRVKRRLEIVVTCEECGAEFCPLRMARRRKFCTRSCASRYNRRRASQSRPAVDQAGQPTSGSG
jgi:hypothetical protein